MKISVKTTAAEALSVNCLVVGVGKGRRLVNRFSNLNLAVSSELARIIEPLRFSSNVGESVYLHSINGLAANSVLLVGLGRNIKLSETDWGKVLRTIISALRSAEASTVGWTLTSIPVRGHDTHQILSQCITAIGHVAYRFEDMKTASTRSEQPTIEQLIITSDAATYQAAMTTVREAQALLKGLTLAKDLANLPANVCTPSYLAEQTRTIATANDRIRTTVIDRMEAEKIGMHAFLAVAAGSRQPPQFIIMEYSGGTPEQAPIVLIGKGVTFDSGGISIKPSNNMDEMKFDMCGAASVLGALVAVAQLNLPINLHVLIPATENLPDGNAIKPGDIVHTMSGQTVEILNTDAEGRLILCDALYYAQRLQPDTVIDVATLTGACVVALGAHASGLFTNDDALAKALLEAGEIADDRAWRLPLWPEYVEPLKSNFADIANIGGREGGAAVAAGFLSKFTNSMRWAHLDIAGTAWKSGSNKGATGRPVGLLFHYLLQRSAK